MATPHTNFRRPTLLAACTWYGAVTFAQTIADRQWARPTQERLASLPPDERKLVEEAVADGLSQQTRFWIDDMYMITALQAQTFRATGDRKYIDRAGKEMAVYLDKLQQPNGLFYHAPDVPFFRGRGNGWMAAGMAELLRSLAEDHPNRARILSGYRKIMATLLQYQMGWHVAAADRSSRVVGRKHRAPACSHSRSSRESSKAGSMRVPPLLRLARRGLESSVI